MRKNGRLICLAVAMGMVAALPAQVVSVYGTDGTRHDFESSEINTISFEEETGQQPEIPQEGTYLPELIRNTPNMQVMGHLLQATGWDKALMGYRDMWYEEQQRETSYVQSGVPGIFSIPKYRFIGYTALVETDDVFQREWGIRLVKDAAGAVTNWNEVLRTVRTKCETVYGTDAAGDFTDSDNAVNRFVAYHLISGKMAYDKLIRHYNEFGYQFGNNKEPQTFNCPTNVWDYYTTMGKHRGLVKITQVGDAGFEHDMEHRIYVNRISEYDNSRQGDYRELGVRNAGVLVASGNGSYANEALNGYVHPLGSILLYSGEVRGLLASERIRMDVVTMFPEMQTNNLRSNPYAKLPAGYLDNITNVSPNTNILYLMDAWSPSAGGWNDYQGDEFIFTGAYDFTLRLPPVPQDGTYELRMGVSMNPLRGMVQIYFGEENRTQAVGLPYDMRQTVGSYNSTIPWVEDVEDEVVNAENDRKLRNAGYLKGPQYIMVTNGRSDMPVRQRGGGAAALRRIITVAEMQAGKTYCLRFKNVLQKSDSQFFLDYLEFVPVQVAKGPVPEDIW